MSGPAEEEERHALRIGTESGSHLRKVSIALMNSNATLLSNAMIQIDAHERAPPPTRRRVSISAMDFGRAHPLAWNKRKREREMRNERVDTLNGRERNNNDNQLDSSELLSLLLTLLSFGAANDYCAVGRRLQTAYEMSQRPSDLVRAASNTKGTRKLRVVCECCAILSQAIKGSQLERRAAPNGKPSAAAAAAEASSRKIAADVYRI